MAYSRRLWTPSWSSPTVAIAWVGVVEKRFLRVRLWGGVVGVGRGLLLMMTRRGIVLNRFFVAVTAVLGKGFLVRYLNDDATLIM